jgi:outer membrane protein assembly factor BamB
MLIEGDVCEGHISPRTRRQNRNLTMFPRNDINSAGLWTTLFVCTLAYSICLGAVPNDESRDEAGQILAETGVQGGLVVHLGCGDGRLTAALGAGEQFLVHGLDTDKASVRRARESVLGTGSYGRVSITAYDGEHLPYADNMVNLLVASQMEDVAVDEINRVLVPGGAAYVDVGGIWKRTIKPWPAEMGQWSHHVHGADGNPVTPDRLVGPPQQVQWLAGPKWQRAHDTDANVNALVSAGGRVFYMVDEAPIGLPGDNDLPDRWLLAARDAFNGVLLWKVPVEKWGWREYKDTHYRTPHDVIPVNVHRRVVATDEHVYATLGIGAPVSRLNADTGEVQHTYAATIGTREILHDNGELILTVPGEAGLKVVVLNAATGDIEWANADEYAGTSKETGKLKIDKQAVLNTAADGDSICFMDLAEVVCLDRRTGDPRWRAKPEASGPELWAGTLILHDGVVLYAEHGKLTALAAKDGARLWVREAKQPGGLWFSWKDVFVIDGLVWTWGPSEGKLVSEAHGHDLTTGEVKQRVPLGPVFKVDHHHRCYRNKATSKFIIASRRGAEFIDLEGGPHTVNNWVRGICHLGMMPANGLLYAPPEPCKCYWYERVSDFCALAPWVPLESASAPLGPLPGPAMGQAEGPKAGADDWPAFRADSARSGSTGSKLPEQLEPVWEASLSGGPSAPIAVGDRVYVAAVDTHTIHALDAATGQEVWHYTAGGRVDSPPTYAHGKLVFGAADGWVTCLRATDGAGVWRFRAAPRERLVGAFSQLESAWPVHGSVVVHDDMVYFAAGRSSYLDGGIHVYGLALESGRLRHHANLQGPEVDLANENWFDGYNDPGGRGALSDILQINEGLICMRNQVFDGKLELQAEPAPAHLQPMGGFLDDTYFKRYYWFYGTPMHRNVYAAMAKPEITEEQMVIALSQLLVQDEEALYGMRMFDSMKLLNAYNFFVPGQEGYLLFKVAPGEGKPKWSERVPIRVRAMAATPGRLVIAGAPDVVDPADPLGAFEARKGGRLRLISTADGSTLEEHEFDSPPAFNGVAVARGRVIVSLEDGRLACLGSTE